MILFYFPKCCAQFLLELWYLLLLQSKGREKHHCLAAWVTRSLLGYTILLNEVRSRSLARCLSYFIPLSDTTATL